MTKIKRLKSTKEDIKEFIVAFLIFFVISIFSMVIVLIMNNNSLREIFVEKIYGFIFIFVFTAILIILSILTIISCIEFMYKTISKKPKKYIFKILKYNALFFLIFIIIGLFIGTISVFSANINPESFCEEESIDYKTIPHYYNDFGYDLEKGEVILVTTTSDEIKADDVSLREAMEITQRDPGNYIIKFDKTLQGGTINVGSSGGNRLPTLKEGGVIINGDINGDGKPDITINNSLPEEIPYGFQISSGNNVLNALRIKNFKSAVLFFTSPEDTNKIIANNVISNNIMEELSYTGIHMGSHDTNEKNNSWINMAIFNNTIKTDNGGIVFFLKSKKESIENVNISNNKIYTGGLISEGISFVAGTGGDSSNNKISNILIENNYLEKKGEIGHVYGIRLAAGDIGAKRNIMENVTIKNNEILMKQDKLYKTVSAGIIIIPGDASTMDYDSSIRPVIYSEDNIIRNVYVVNNKIKEFGGWAIDVFSGCLGSRNISAENIYVYGNKIDMFNCHSRWGGTAGGIKVTTGSSFGMGEGLEYMRRTKGNKVSNIEIKDNDITITKPKDLPNFVFSSIFPSVGAPVGIFIFEEIGNYIELANITHNRIRGGGIIDMSAKGVHEIAGAMGPNLGINFVFITELKIFNNIKGLSVSCNEAKGPITVMINLFYFVLVLIGSYIFTKKYVLNRISS